MLYHEDLDLARSRLVKYCMRVAALTLNTNLHSHAGYLVHVHSTVVTSSDKRCASLCTTLELAVSREA